MAENVPTPPAILKELTTAAFNQWRHEPITKLFLAYLSDKAEDYQDRVLADLLSDSLSESMKHEYRGRIWLLRELSELPLDAIKELYGIATPEEKETT